MVHTMQGINMNIGVWLSLCSGRAQRLATIMGVSDQYISENKSIGLFKNNIEKLYDAMVTIESLEMQNTKKIESIVLKSARLLNHCDPEVKRFARVEFLRWGELLSIKAD